MKKTREVVLVLGETGSGKTTWAKKYTDAETRLFVYDIAHDFRANYVSSDELIELQDEPPAQFRIGVWTPDDVEPLTASAYLWGNCTLVLEELSTLYRTGERISGPIAEVVYLGRHQTVSLVCIAQRATSIPVAIRSQASRIVSFRQQEDDDVKALVGKFGKENAQKLTRMQDLHCIDWHKGDITEYKISFAGERTDDSEVSEYRDVSPDDIDGSPDDINGS